MRNRVRISKHKSIFAKGYNSCFSEDVSVIKNVKILYHEHMYSKTLMEEKLLVRFIKNELKKTNQKEVRTKKKLRKNVINFMCSKKI